jgi:hypothetical protein
LADLVVLEEPEEDEAVHDKQQGPKPPLECRSGDLPQEFAALVPPVLGGVRDDTNACPRFLGGFHDLIPPSKSPSKAIPNQNHCRFSKMQTMDMKQLTRDPDC